MSSVIDIDLVRTLERKAFRAWPALDCREIDGWVQRFAGGYTKRANSINALEPGLEFDKRLMKALEQRYLELGLPPVWRLSPLAPPSAEAALAERSYRRADESLVQRAPLQGQFALDPEVEIAPSPSRMWLEGFAALSPVAPAHRQVMARMLARISAPVGFACVEHQGQPIAFALGVVDGDDVGLFDVLVAPAARGRGLARRLTESICAWGQQQGAHFAYLQVVATNVAALPLYAQLGFATVYSYAYRVP
jgi:GNAT superfamily N-acetyltransferase